MENLIKNLENKKWYLHHSIFIDSCELFDSRRNQSKINILFCRKVFNAVDDGANVVIVTPDVSFVDKRLRDKAIIFSLPRSDDANLF
jgi:hypothetical protein